MTMLFEEGDIAPSLLHIDLLNPRLPDRRSADEADAVRDLYDTAAVDELVQSIAASGWFSFEPMIVLRRDNKLNIENVVIEGNRRLAALRLLNDGGRLAAQLKISVPQARHNGSDPETVRVWYVDARSAARDFIGFKHINGPFKWDSLAKAKYAAEWLDEIDDLTAVSTRLGDSNNTIARLVNGWRVLQQSEAKGFDRSTIKGRFAFSHLYTGLARPALRNYLGLPVQSGLLPKDPVDVSHGPRLLQSMVWLYGDDEQPALIKSQNPDLKRLLEVLENQEATTALENHADLGFAHELVEDKGAKFADDLFELYRQARVVSGEIALYDGDPALVEIAGALGRTIRSITGSIERENAQASPESGT